VYVLGYVNLHTDDALQKFGIEKQSIVAMEEAAEFIQAVSKAVRNPSEATEDHLAEEIAGVLMMIDQLETYYGLRGKIISHIHTQNEKLAKYLSEA
jgi:NTP pyrophosphatase (non-canonical NTP hydrolase)